MGETFNEQSDNSKMKKQPVIGNCIKRHEMISFMSFLLPKGLCDITVGKTKLRISAAAYLKVFNIEILFGKALGNKSKCDSTIISKSIVKYYCRVDYISPKFREEGRVK